MLEVRTKALKESSLLRGICCQAFTQPRALDFAASRSPIPLVRGLLKRDDCTPLFLPDKDNFFFVSERSGAGT